MSGVNGTSSSSEHGDVNLDNFLSQDYDFIICGGGTAGLTLAARLTEIPSVTVGVLEVGKNRLGDMLVETPAMHIQLLGNPEYDFNLQTTKQVNGTTHHMPRGKMLGGSSGQNYMMYVRGSNQDYDDWAELAEDSAWSSSNMKHYMKKHQTMEPVDPKTNQRTATPFAPDENHGTNGPIHTSFNDPAAETPLEDDVVQAFNYATGLTKKPVDPWSGDHIGFYNTLGCVSRTGPNKGKRSYAANGYFQPNKDRPNLRVLCEAMVTKVNLDNDTATSVTFTHKDSSHTIKAKNEIIISGGTIHSPQILQLSGIGDREVLSKAGIPCQIPLPGVGKNLQDHTLTYLSYELSPPHMSADCIHLPEVMQGAMQAYQTSQSGPLTSIAAVQGYFSITSSFTEEEVATLKSRIQSTLDEPETTPFHKTQLSQYLAHLTNPSSANVMLQLIPITSDPKGIPDQSKLFPVPSDPATHANQFALVGSSSYMAGRGSVHPTSADPKVQPEINPAYLTHPADVLYLSTIVRTLLKGAEAPSLKDKISRRVSPPSDTDLTSDAEREAYILKNHLGQYHPIGTCAMGDVVDSHLRVKGVKGLRVCDASVFPNHVSGNIQSSVYATAEHTADIIKREYGWAVDTNGVNGGVVSSVINGAVGAVQGGLKQLGLA